MAHPQISVSTSARASVLPLGLNREGTMAEIIIKERIRRTSMVKVRRESNEELAPEQLPPAAGVSLELERLEQLRRVTFKEKLASKAKRIRKPKKQV